MTLQGRPNETQPMQFASSCCILPVGYEQIRPSVIALVGLLGEGGEGEDADEDEDQSVGLQTPLKPRMVPTTVVQEVKFQQTYMIFYNSGSQFRESRHVVDTSIVRFSIAIYCGCGYNRHHYSEYPR